MKCVVRVLGVVTDAAPFGRAKPTHGASEGGFPMQLFAFQRLDIYRAALELVVLVQRAEIRDAELRDHARRSAKSVLLNTGEGLPERGSGLRHRRFTTAVSELGEVAAAIDAAVALEAIEAAKAERIFACAARVKPMLYGLLRPRR